MLRWALLTLWLLLLVGAGWLAVDWWRSVDAAAGVRRSVPGMDDPENRREADLARLKNQPFSLDIYRHFGVTVTDAVGAWPAFRGQHRDGISHEKIPLADSFSANGPRKLWSIPLGQGYAGAAVHKGRVFVMDHIEGQGDVLRCFRFSDGAEMWRSGYSVFIGGNHGITRTVPAVTDLYTVTMGPMAHVMCVETDTGKPLWGHDIASRYGVRDLTTMWYTGQCPLIDGDNVIIAPAGSNVLMVAFSCATGETIWEAPNPHGWNMSHSSIVPMTVDGVRMYLYAAVGGVAAIGAEGEYAGQILWETDSWTSSVLMPSPVVLDDNRVFLTSGYDGGSALFRIEKSKENVFTVTELFNFSGRRDARNCFSTYQHTPVYYEGHLFGIQLNSARERRMEFSCVDIAVPGGDFIWSSGDETVFTSARKREAWGPWLLADGKFYVMGDTGLLVLFDANTQERRKLGEWQLFDDGYEVWGPLAITEGRLLVRDVNRLACFDISAEGKDPQ